MIEESPHLGYYYPGFADREVNKYGSSKGWRRNRLRTASGFTIDALGLDRAARGLLSKGVRPGFVLLDDLDDREDSELASERKIRQVTRKILPAGTADLAVLAVQNLPNRTGFFGRMLPDAEKPADYLQDRILVGPVPALDDPVYVEDPQKPGAWTIASGTATWEGQNLDDCRSIVKTEGLSAFRTERQHEPETVSGGLYDEVIWQRMHPHDFERRCASGDIVLVRTAVWIDPAISATDRSDAQAVQCDSLALDGTIYRRASWEKRSSPLRAMRQGLRWAREFGATRLGIETDQGGDTWDSVYVQAALEELTDLLKELVGSRPADDRVGAEAARLLPLALENAGRAQTLVGWTVPNLDDAKAGSVGSKGERQGRMVAEYQRGLLVHVEGHHVLLEAALTRMLRQKPFDLADAAYWSWADLRGLVEIVAPPPPDIRIPRVRDLMKRRD